MKKPIKPKLSEKGQLMLGWLKRIKHQEKQLAETKKFHRGVEQSLEKRIRMSKIQLASLKRTK